MMQHHLAEWADIIHCAAHEARCDPLSCGPHISPEPDGSETWRGQDKAAAGFPRGSVTRQMSDVATMMAFWVYVCDQMLGTKKTDYLSVTFLLCHGSQYVHQIETWRQIYR